MAAQFTATKAPRLPDSSWSALATTSFPVPVSPPITTGSRERAIAGRFSSSAASSGDSVARVGWGAAGRAASGTEERNSKCVSPTCSASRSATSRSRMGSPLMKVPFVLPLSSTRKRSPSRSSRAWAVDIHRSGRPMRSIRPSRVGPSPRQSSTSSMPASEWRASGRVGAAPSSTSNRCGALLPERAGGRGMAGVRGMRPPARARRRATRPAPASAAPATRHLPPRAPAGRRACRSKTRTMPGCSRDRAIESSRRNRSRVHWSCTRCACSSLTATSAPVARSRAANTSASPPAPMRPRSSNLSASSTAVGPGLRNSGHRSATAQQVAQPVRRARRPRQIARFRLARPLLPAPAQEVHMVIEELDPTAAPEWDDYVARKEGANCYHLRGWRTAGERGYGLRAPFLAARARPRGELLGVLPLFFVRSSPLSGYATTGLFGAYGPVLADDFEISGLLLREACRRARDAGLASLRFKGLGEEPGAQGFVPLDHWVVATLPLWSSPDQAWAAIRGKERNLVRKAREHGLEVRRGSSDLRAFYDALAANMHHKGAPIYGQRWIEEVVRSFGEAAEVVTVHHRGRCVAGAVTLTFKGVITVPFLSARPEALPLRPNFLLD